VQWELVQDRYRNIIHADELDLFHYHHLPLSKNISLPDPYLFVQFVPTSLGTYRFLRQMEFTINLMGLAESDKEQILMFLSPDRIYFFALTTFVSILHTIFTILAFKNDVNFWRRKNITTGLSQTTIISNAICDIILFLFLIDNRGTSWLVIGTMGASSLIDIWKVTKVLKIDFLLRKTSEKSEAEKQTDYFDAKGLYYLSMILVPLLIGWSIYCLYTYPYKTWWSWFISSAANGVYAFGFLLMTPQLFINYKLKSVSHMPWRAMTYRVFITFIDDIFALIIEMPTIHRVATLRNDIVFFIYLYQRWIYPEDKSRPYELGDNNSVPETKDNETKEKTE